MKKKVIIYYIVYFVLFPSICPGASLEILTADGNWNYEIGDTIDFDIYIDADGEDIGSFSIYLTFEEEYFQVILHGAGNDDPFFQGDFLNGMVLENDTHQDPGNSLPGFQLNYSEALMPPGSSISGEGIAASFSLIAMNEVESSTIVFDTSMPTRITMYTVPELSGFLFEQLITHELTITDPSSSVRREIQPVKTPLLSCYPNPFNSSVNVSFTLLKPSSCRLIVCDIMGRSLLEEVFFSGAGDINRNIDLNHLPSGVYYVSLLITGNSHTVYKICKVN